MSLDIKKLRELEQAATPGPWTLNDAPTPDHRLIAAMRNALPELLDAAEEVVEIRGVEKELSRRTDEIVRLTAERDAALVEIRAAIDREMIGLGNLDVARHKRDQARKDRSDALHLLAEANREQVCTCPYSGDAARGCRWCRDVAVLLARTETCVYGDCAKCKTGEPCR